MSLATLAPPFKSSPDNTTSFFIAKMCLRRLLIGITAEEKETVLKLVSPDTGMGDIIEVLSHQRACNCIPREKNGLLAPILTGNQTYVQDYIWERIIVSKYENRCAARYLIRTCSNCEED